MKLYNGNCLEIMKELPDNSIDFILTDLPYGTTRSKWDNIIPYNLMWEQCHRIIKKQGNMCFFANNPFMSALINSNIENYKYEWVWIKNTTSMFIRANYRPLKYTEFIVNFSLANATYTKNGNSAKYYPIKTKKDKPTKVEKNKNIPKSIKHGFSENYKLNQNASNYSFPKNYLYYNLDKPHTHPTQKPIALLEYLIKTYTLENEVVLDFTMGSGSTGVACVNTNRNFIGIELDKEYYKIAKERIDEKLYNNTN